jgi:hypothetical protein
LSQNEWLKLRTFSGSQESAFEEVCKQLFGAECRAVGGMWIPKGKIDAGVEGYCVLPNGDQWGLQAKWFLTSPGPPQWSQVDESVRVALESHGRLVRYVVCMPVDLSDANTKGKRSARARWEDRRLTYERWATERSMSVAFEFRGSHELMRELTAVENRGMRSYWFGGPEFSPESVKRRIADTLSAVGPRYSKKLNVAIPLLRFTDAMRLSERFITRVFEHYRAVRKWMSTQLSDNIRRRWASQSDDVSTTCQAICELLEPLAADNNAPIDWARVTALSKHAASHCQSLAEAVREASSVEAASSRTSSSAKRNPYEHRLYELWKLVSALETLQEFADGAETRLSRAPYMLLVGEAGSGKTHFLCDVAASAVDEGDIAILVLGRDEFTDNSVWGEIARGNSLPSDHEKLLGALHSAAEATGTRSLLLIDAINEGPGPKFWMRELSVIVAQVQRFPRVALVVSVRDTFLTALVRPDAKKQFVEVVHEGFSYDIVEAQRAFFQNFRIREPSVPLLLPEFANPLFLMLFCTGIVAEGLSEVPRGLSGLSAIFTFFVDAQNRKISVDLDVDPDSRIVHRALEALAGALTPQRPNAIGREEAKEIVDRIHSSPLFSRSLLGALEREGLLSAVQWGTDSYVRFTYERIADHARGRLLLAGIDKGVALEDLTARIRELVADLRDRFRSEGLFEALSIQVPERYGHELIQLLSKPIMYWEVEALLRTLPWRQPQSVPQETKTFVLRLLDQGVQLRESVFECFLSCALIAGHPFNATSLHEYLLGLDLPQRDAVWTIPISGRQYEGSAVMRMTSWALEGAFGLGSDTQDGSIAAEAAVTTLLWLCTSTNRRVRDSATKGIVAILDAVPTIASAIYVRFCAVNDPYVLQRLYAALAGNAMRTYQASDNLADLARAVLDRARSSGLPVDLLARDYARTIVERAMVLGSIAADDDIKAVRPPYGTGPPDATEADTALFQKYDWSARESTQEKVPHGLLQVHSSLGPHGDFARYIVGTNSRGEWLTTPVLGNAPLTPRERSAAFIASLNPAQHKLHKKMVSAERVASSDIFRVLRDVLDEPSSGAVADVLDSGPTQEIAHEARHDFVASLDSLQRHEFDQLNESPAEIVRFDLTRATHWMFRRVLEMGYGGEAVYEFDERAARDAWQRGEGRQPATIERIGKKYQWIVYFEFLARMADNYYLDSWMTDDIPKQYETPPQLLSRDIDPSLLVVETRKPSFDPHPQVWWAGPSYGDWQDKVTTDLWMRDPRKLPDPRDVLAVTDPDAQDWVCLNTHLSWREREALLNERYDVPRRELWYRLSSYLVPKTKAQRAYRWLRRQNFSGGHFRPQPRDVYRLHWGELFWAPSFVAESAGLRIAPDVLEDIDRKTTPNLLISTTGIYLHERADDGSVLDTIRIDFPIADIVHGIGGVRSAPERGAWLDASGQTVCFDPSVVQPGPGAVLARRDLLEAFLLNSPFALVWTLLSEKQIIGGNTFGTRYGRLVTSGAYWLHETSDQTFHLEGGMTSRFEE